MKLILRLRIYLALAVLFLASFEGLERPRPAEAAASGAIIYVDASNNGGTYNGSSWATAYRRLQNALNNAASGDQIWVANGVYYPDEGPAQTNNDPLSSFVLKNGVAVYGGFAGTETLLNQRNIAANVTILSGDVDNNDTNNDGNFIAEAFGHIQGSNAYHVVTGSGVNSTAILDGFTITAGYAYFYSGSPADTRSLGGGMYNASGSPMLANLTFTGNAGYQGGGMYNGSSSPTLSNVTFTNNTASNSGGGIYNKTSSPVLSDVSLIDNLGYEGGGGMVNVAGSNPLLTRVTLQGNHADNPLANSSRGGGMDNIDSDPVLVDVDFTSNSTDGYGGGMANTRSEPRLTRVVFDRNASSVGAAIYNTDVDSTSVYTDVVFYRNQGDVGGAMYLVRSNMRMSRVTFDYNFAALEGGGMYISVYSSPVLTNVTFGGNQAVNTGGALYIRGYSNPSLTHVTINANGASDYGGLHIIDNSQPLLRNTLVANNAVYECYKDATSGLNPASSYNLVESSAGACGLANGVNNNIVGQDPLAGSLEYNGGFSKTFALTNGSPAIDAGSGSFCPPTDQRGVTRPKDGDGNASQVCDLGAYEAELQPNLAVSKSNNVDGKGFVGSPFTWKLAVVNSGLQNAAFTSGQVILRDQLPTSGATYAAPLVQNMVNLTNGNNLSCSITANTLTCSASGGAVTLGAGTGGFEVLITVTPTAVLTLENPRSGGTCQVDPNNVLAESIENNNNCATNRVVVKLPSYLPFIRQP